MRNFLTIYLKELRSYFISPVAYIVGLVYALLVGFFAFQMFAAFSEESLRYGQMRMRMPDAPGLDITQMCVTPFFWISNLMLVFVVPLLTMRLLAEEKRQGTFELLFSYPLRDAELVFAKFFACVTVMLLVILSTMAYIAFVFGYGDPHPPVLWSGAIGLVLLVGAYVSMGLFWSSVTDNQVVAAVLAFANLLLFWIMVGIEQSLEATQAWIARVVAELNTVAHFREFTEGVVDTSHVAYFLLVTAFFLYFTLRILESKHWRG